MTNEDVSFLIYLTQESVHKAQKWVRKNRPAKQMFGYGMKDIKNFIDKILQT